MNDEVAFGFPFHGRGCKRVAILWIGNQKEVRAIGRDAPPACPEIRTFYAVVAASRKSLSLIIFSGTKVGSGPTNAP